MTLLDLMKLAAESEELEVDHDDALEMMTLLQDKSRLELPDPPKLQGTLRDYQNEVCLAIFGSGSQRLLSR